jgi:hypothetical protein
MLACSACGTVSFAAKVIALTVSSTDRAVPRVRAASFIASRKEELEEVGTIGS